MIFLTFSPANDAFYREGNMPGKYHTIIDLYNLADQSKFSITFKNRKDFPEIANWMQAARKEYLSFLATLSQIEIKKNVSIRDIKLYNLPLYWLTAMAEKHPRTNWLFSFFLFQEFIKSNYYKDEKVVIYLNHQTRCLKDVIINLNAKSEFVRNISFYCPDKKKALNELIEIIKRQIQSFFYTIKQSPLNTSLQEEQIQIITQDTNQVFYKQFINSEIFKDQKIAFKPLNIFTLSEENAKYISSSFFKSRTNIWDKMHIFLCSVMLFFRVLFIKKQLKVNGITYPASLVKNEFYDVLKNAQVYFNIYLIYKSYFKQIKSKTLFFLQNEFYRYGRVISKAWKDSKNPKIKLYGLQHGMFSESHTVYTILPEEIRDVKPGDSIPLPEKFIVWGIYFKHIFQKISYCNTDFIIELGSPYYIYLHKKIETLKGLNNDHSYLLWCTTGQEQFLFEKPFVLKLMELYGLPLVIRNHPLGHISKEFLEKTMDRINYSLDTFNDIHESILNSACVVTSAHSTVVLDCLVCEKKVYRIIFDRSDDEFNEPSDLIINIKQLSDLKRVDLKYQKSSVQINRYLYLHKDRWNALKNNLN